jgi:MFS family permease
MPLWPLIASLAAQTLATMALFSLPAIAPAVTKALGVPGELVGMFVSVAYGVGIVSALLSPGFIHRYGGVRALQAVLLATAAMLLLAAGGSLAWVAISAVVLGLGYGAAAPASTHLLVPHTPARVFNMVMSLRQIGVPLGGVLGSLILPPLALHVGWRAALLAEVPVVLLLIALLELPRRRWDIDTNPTRRLLGRALLASFALLREGAMLRLSIASFIYSGMQLCFIAFMTTHLTTVAGFDLIGAGRHWRSIRSPVR